MKLKSKFVLNTFLVLLYRNNSYIFYYYFISEAIETRHALHGIRWPTSNPKCLNVDFGSESLMEKAIASTADEVKPSIHSRDERIASSNDIHEINRDKVILI